MSQIPQPPKSPTLLPPRKSVELEDPGAHELSDNDDDHFSDAQEDREHSGPQSPIPVTRVEKVDDRGSHGEVPGTDAYRIRTQDAVPDEVEIIPEGGHSRSASKSRSSRPGTPGGTPVPKTVVEKVDPTSPSLGDVPGTKAHLKRQADAVPDIVRPIPSGDDAAIDSNDHGANISSEAPVPTTIITKVDSEPSHGEVPGTEAFNMRKEDAKPDIVEKKGDVAGRSDPFLMVLSSSGPLTESGLPIRSKQKRPKSIVDTASPIAADGGFGQMESDESEEGGEEEEREEKEEVGEEADEERHAKSETMELRKEVGGDGFGDDFDEFEAGALDEDFGDFDEEEYEPEPVEPPATSIQSLPPIESPFPVLEFNDLDNIDDMVTAMSAYLDEMFPTTKEEFLTAPPPSSDQNSIFLTDRSASLWSQLVAPPPLQPPNWIRSRIRRLFLVSLGVPVDLDEILPASKQRKLILPSTHLRSGSQSPPKGSRAGSRVRFKQDNESTTSVDKTLSGKASRRRKGPPAAPDLDLQATKMLCTTTEAALDNMTDEELQAHVKTLEELTVKASQALEYWLKRRDSALGDKEAFEGVIENLVKHARRVRK